jgi:hypothetical protein
VAIKQKRCLTLAIVYDFFAVKKVLIVSEGVGLDTKNTRIDTIGQVNVIIIEKMVRNQGDKCNRSQSKISTWKPILFPRETQIRTVK